MLEFFCRVLFFFPTNLNVFKYGLKKTVSFDILDLSKLQISVYDNDQKIYKKDIKNSNNRFWIFGGSTTYGYNCENKQSSSWPEEIYKINNNFNFKNYAFNGANSDQQLILLQKEIIKKKPDVILWANKFNTLNVIRSKDYKNKNILKYEFTKSSSTDFFVFVKEVDKTIKNYSILYSLLDRIIYSINFHLKRNPKIITPTKQDLVFALKNFELNTKNAIEISIAHDVKEFFIISLFHDDKNYDHIEKYKFQLYNKSINNIVKKFYPYVKVINLNENFKYLNKSDLLCDTAHQTLKGNILQGKFINEILIKESKIINE